MVSARRTTGYTYTSPVQAFPRPLRYTNGLGTVRGMGDTTGAVNTGVKTGATVGGILAPNIAGALGLAVPVVGAAIAGISMAVSAWVNRMGPKQKRWTTDIANDATAQLQQVKSVYFSSAYNPLNQQKALEAVDLLLAAIQEGCSQTQMGEPGRRCISERLVRGGSAPWCPTGTGCDYFTEYRHPIANDPRAVEWTQQVQQTQQAQTVDALGVSPITAVSALVSSNPLVGLGIAGAVTFLAFNLFGGDR